MSKNIECRPNLSEWFKNPPESLPGELTDHIDCEKAFKITILSDDFVFIYDENLFDVHALFNKDSLTMLFMNGRMNDKEFTASNSGENIKELFKW